MKIIYDALRYIEFPCIEAEVQAIKNNESAINFINNLNKEKLLILMKENILVIKYVSKNLLNQISQEEIENLLKEVISKEEISEKYIRDFINCTLIGKNSEYFNMDKIMFIYQYGSKLAKKIAVDEKLKII